MSTENPTPHRPRISRRTLTAGVAWSVPTIAVAGAAPAIASSLRKDPGINGWVNNSPRSRGGCSWTLEVDSTASGTGPDGAPFGLYVYDVEDDMAIENPKLVYWIIGDQSATWTTLAGHSSCWNGPTRGTPQTKADNLVYTPYTWEYTCDIDPSTRQLDDDGVERLYLGDFHVRASFTQPRDRCNNVTYWTQRFITIDGEEKTFERRNGSLGPYRAGSVRSAAGAEAVPATALS